MGSCQQNARARQDIVLRPFNIDFDEIRYNACVRNKLIAGRNRHADIAGLIEFPQRMVFSFREVAFRGYIRNSAWDNVCIFDPVNFDQAIQIRPISGQRFKGMNRFCIF